MEMLPSIPAVVMTLLPQIGAIAGAYITKKNIPTWYEVSHQFLYRFSCMQKSRHLFMIHAQSRKHPDVNCKQTVKEIILSARWHQIRITIQNYFSRVSDEN